MNGVKSEYSYDAGNRLVKSVTDGIVSSYKYDGAGRLVSEKSGSTSKTYEYGWLDKVMKLSEGKDVTEFSYYADGQLAELETAGKSEQFYWDGLALVKRNEIKYLNEPYVTGGNPVSANGKVIFNDMLGSSMGSIENGNYQPIKRTAFGETSASSSVDFFTGKPNVEGLGYAFLFRNYRSDLGKWQTADPLGYPDGWNNFAYVNNWTTFAIDPFGTAIYELYTSKAAAGFGHSAQIVTWTDSSGACHAKYYDYGLYSSGSSTGCNTGDLTGPTADSAIFRAIAALDPAGTKYESMTAWNADDSQSQAAASTMDSFTQQSYSPDEHNCRDNLNTGLDAAGLQDQHSTSNVPSIAHTEDTTNYSDYIKDGTTSLKRVQKALRAAAE